MVKKNPPKINFGILTTFDHPLLPFYLSEIEKKRLKNVSIICDSKIRGKKSTDIWLQRTQASFNDRYREEFQLHNYDPQFKFYFVDNHNSIEALKLYSEINLNCFLNAGTPRKIGGELIRNSGLGVVNIHPGVLPKYRGSCAVEWAIINDDQIGNTAHFMNEDYDAGPIIDIEKYIFGKVDSYVDIRSRVFMSGIKLAINVLKFAQDEGTIYSTSQDEKHSDYYSPINNKQLLQIEQKLQSQQYKFQK
tara:strand:- start:1727 stop:2470 length:744 start_codon:yes stop_codon:yes gene_type:complete